jgi:Predicted membrane protein
MIALLGLSGCGQRTPDSVIVALGNEPFWNVRVTAHEILYRDPEHQEGYRFPLVAAVVEGDARVFRTRREPPADDLGPRILELRIRQGVCSDGMSDREYSMNAQLKIGDETRTGCAYHESAAEEVRTGGQ